jgi:hypothetical protein
MTGQELDYLELGGDRPAYAMVSENAPRWASHMLTGAANYVSTMAIYARYPIRLDTAGMGSNAVAQYQRRYLLDGRTRTWGIP